MSIFFRAQVSNKAKTTPSERSNIDTFIGSNVPEFQKNKKYIYGENYPKIPAMPGAPCGEAIFYDILEK